MIPRQRTWVYVAAFALAAAGGCSPDAPRESVQEHPALPGPDTLHGTAADGQPPKDVRVVVVGGDPAGWGYEVFVDSASTPYIRQPIIPAVPGNKGFATFEDATKVGELVRHKIMHNILPPSVSVEELDSLGITR